MALQTTVNISVDFYDKKYILINAKQFDRKSRFLSVACYNHGELYPLNEGEHSAYIRYRKADNNSVFNFCEINRKGNIIVELTEQMLAADGICCADLVIVNEGGAKVNASTGEIVGINNSSILSTMLLHIDVTGTAVENSDIESSYEFNGLNTALEKAEAEYTEVMKTSKSWAVGGTGIRSGEDTDNSKYYSKQSSNSASAANTSALNAANSETLAEEHMQDALVYSQNAQTYMSNAKTYMNNASTYMDNAEEYMDNANDSKDKAEEYMNIAKSYMDDAESSKITAESYMDNAEEYANNAAASALNASTSEANAKTSEQNALVSEKNAKTSEVNASASEQNAKTAQSAAETAENNAKQAASQAAKDAAELAAQNAVDNVTILMNGYVTSAQDAATRAQSIVDGLSVATVDEVKEYLGIE